MRNIASILTDESDVVMLICHNDLSADKLIHLFSLLLFIIL